MSITNEDDAVAVAALLSHNRHVVEATDNSRLRKRVSPVSRSNGRSHKKLRTTPTNATTEVPSDEVTLLTTSRLTGAKGYEHNISTSQMQAHSESSYNSLKEQLLHGRSTIPSQIQVDPATLMSQTYRQQQYNLHGNFPGTALHYVDSPAANSVQSVPTRATIANRPFYPKTLGRANGKKYKALAKKRDPETRRLVHNLAEKRRQHKINDFINQLRQIMFDYSQKVIPKGKAKILQNTVDFIQTLVEDNCTLHKKIGLICEKNPRPANLEVEDLHWTPAEALAGGKRVLQTLEHSTTVEGQK